MPVRLKLPPNEIEFYKPLIASYLKHGSVDKVFGKLYQNPGVSYPHFHRILKRWGIIKSAGSQSHLTEAVYFLTALAKNNLPLETIYKTMPPSLRVSAVTLHRILSYIKRGVVRRIATTLIITPESDKTKVLIGKDISTPRPEIGKTFGSLSLPMTFSKRTEAPFTSIKRVLQQEVITNLALAGQTPEKLIPPNPAPIMTIDIADIRVNVYHLVLPDKMNAYLSSFKLKDLSFVPLEKVAVGVGLESRYRAGVPEIVEAYIELSREAGSRFAGQTPTQTHLNSLLNRSLALLPAYA